MSDREKAIEVMYGKRKDIGDMSKEELKEELRILRVLWDWVDERVKDMVSRVGQTVAVTRRDYKRYIGNLLDCKWELKEINIECGEKVWDSEAGCYVYEHKTLRVPANSILHTEFIIDRTEWVEDEGAKAELSA